MIRADGLCPSIKFVNRQAELLRREGRLVCSARRRIRTAEFLTPYQCQPIDFAQPCWKSLFKFHSDFSKRAPHDFGQRRQSDSAILIKLLILWYSWVDSNRRPPDPQSGALTN